MCKVLLISAIHLCKIRHIAQKYGTFDDLVQRRASFGEDGFDVFAASGCLDGDGTGYEGTVGFAGDLARDED
jgi:hypothetical protein